MSEPTSETKIVTLNSSKIEIPVDWSTVTIGDVTQKTKGTKPSTLYDGPAEDRLPYLTISASQGEISHWANTDDGKRVSDGQVLIVWDGASSGTVFKSSEGIIGSTLASLEFESGEFNSEFAYYFLSYLENRISELSEGTGIPHVPRDFTDIFQILQPQLPEQRRIADILSTVDKQIQLTDEIIEARKELVQGLIDELVKKGVQNTPEVHKVQIGPKQVEIPTDWDVLRVDELVASDDDAIRTGPFGSKLKKEYLVSEGIKVYEQSNGLW
jgi:type I restriction enzyme S subunit